MKILHVIGAYHPATSYGGPTESTRRLCAALAQLGQEVTVLTTDADGRRRLSEEWRGWREVDGCRVFYGPRSFPPDLSFGLLAAIRDRVGRNQVAHATGTYNWFIMPLGAECRRRRVPLVVSPRGSLIPAARRHRHSKKALFDLLGHWKTLTRVSSFHATSEPEAAAIRAQLPHVPVRVVPNGVEIPEPLPERPSLQTPYLLYLGRLHPFKRVDRIIGAFAGLRANPTLQLWIAGDGEPTYREALARKATEAGVGGRTRFLGPVHGEAKRALLASAEALVLASTSESFGMSVAEALAHATPCVVTRTAPWEGLEREACGFWVEDTLEGLADGIARLVSLPPDRVRAMGMRGRLWMARDFSWTSMARRMLGLYESSLLEAGGG